ncbi:MAG TPA: hypothetical protein VNY24_14475 [Candidatus Acidoferrales bacterium]|jgi:hypothetical protein|nr:hypothetical protein [Candidatus Acidoferrales bacterium]
MSRQQEETCRDGIDQPVGDLWIAAFPGNVVPDFVKFGCNLRGKEERNEPRLPIRLESNAPSALYIFGEVPRRLFGHYHCLTAERHFSLIYGGENFASSALAFLPKLKCFLDGVFSTANPAIFDGLANERLLVWV